MILAITCSGWSYACPNSLAPSSLLVRLVLVNMDGHSIKHHGYLGGSNPPVDKLSLSLFQSFTEISWKVASPLVFSFDAVSQIVFNVLGNPQLIMAYIYGFPKAALSPTHAAAVVTPPTLWWFTSLQYPCLPLKFLNLDPTYINTAVLSSP